MSAAMMTKPQPQAASHARRQQQQQLIRLGALLALVALLAFPHIRSPLFGLDWRPALAPALAVLATPMPPEPIDLGVFAITLRPLGQWLAWGLAAFLWFVAASLLLHLGTLYAQRTRPLGQRRAYLRLALPSNASAKPADAATLLESLHGMVAPINPLQPAPAPLMLCWTAQPERKIQQALSVAGPATTIMGVQKRLQSIAGGAKAAALEDPLLEALQPGRFLCVADVRAAAGADLPIATLGREHVLLPALLSSLAPQAGVVLASARMVLEPIPDRFWRLGVLAKLEQTRPDLGEDERQAFKAKAAGPAFRTRLLLMAVAHDPRSGAAQLETIAAALAASTQPIALTAQRLVAGPVQIFPAVPPPHPPFPKLQLGFGAIVGALIAIVLALVLWRSGGASARPLLWALPLIVLWLPALALAARWRKRIGADMAQRHAAILAGALPPRNPRVVPIWWPWLGYLE